METALNIATYAFLATLGFGLLLLGYGIWGWWVWRRYHLPAPTMERLPTRSLDAAHKALEGIRSRYFHASGEKRNRLGLELQRLEMRIHHVQQRTNEDQFTYYQLCKRREKSWRDWKKFFDHVDTLNRRERRKNRTALADATKQFRSLDKLVHDEWHRALVLDEMNLQELRTQGVLPPEESAAAAAAADGPPEESGASRGPGKPGPVQAFAPEQQEAGEAAPSQATPAALPAHGAAAADPPADETSPPFATGASGAMHQEDFAMADLPKAGLRYADPEFNMAVIPGGLLADANLSGASFAGVRMTGTQIFRRCNLSGIDLRGVALPRAEQPHQFVNCDLTGASFAQASIEYVLFLRCELSYSQWQQARLNRVKFSECRIAGADWSGVDLSRTIISPDMQGPADFTQAAQPPHISAPSPYAPGTRPASGQPAPGATSPIAPTPAPAPPPPNLAAAAPPSADEP
jgi:uncharacterized protein YjbI with pentapeptide repeats